MLSLPTTHPIFPTFSRQLGPTWENDQVDSGALDDDGNIIYVPAVGQTRVRAGGFSAHTADSTAPDLTVFDMSTDLDGNALDPGQNVNIALDSALL
jgi:hypothetical protein